MSAGRPSRQAITGYPYDSKYDCPDADKHTEPENVRRGDLPGFLAWAREMGKTHRQERCPTCRYWVIWTPRAAGGGSRRDTTG